MDLKDRKCKPCEGGTKSMSRKEALKYLRLTKGWKLQGNSIYKETRFKDFKRAIAFIRKVADIAESEGHHPDIYLHGWNRVMLTLSTHAIKGLSINDFILASKVDSIK